MSLQPKNYETVFIINPVIGEKDIKDIVKRIEDLIISNGGNLINTYSWGVKKLAYTIRKKTSGYYHIIEFKAPTGTPGFLETAYKREENIIRYITVALDKHAVGYNERKQKGIKYVKPQKEVVEIEN